MRYTHIIQGKINSCWLLTAAISLNSSSSQYRDLFNFINNSDYITIGKFTFLIDANEIMSFYDIQSYHMDSNLLWIQKLELLYVKIMKRSDEIDSFDYENHLNTSNIVRGFSFCTFLFNKLMNQDDPIINTWYIINKIRYKEITHNYVFPKKKQFKIFRNNLNKRDYKNTLIQ